MGADREDRTGCPSDDPIGGGTDEEGSDQPMTADPQNNQIDRVFIGITQQLGIGLSFVQHGDRLTPVPGVGRHQIVEFGLQKFPNGDG